MRWLTPVSAFFLAALFLFTGVDKAFHYSGFIQALRSYALVPDGGAPIVAPAVVAAELAAGAGLLVRGWRHAAAAAAAGLLTVFTLALAVNLLWMPNAVCGCWFSLTLAESTTGHLLQNVLFLALAVSVAWDSRSTNAAARRPPAASPFTSVADPEDE